jgi:hypothetical protein
MRFERMFRTCALKKRGVKGFPALDFQFRCADRLLRNVATPDVAIARRQARIEKRRMSDLSAHPTFAS